MSTPRIGFYTIALGDDPETQFEKFDAKDFTHHQEERNIIYKSLQRMGLRGAKLWYFRDERGAHALPGKDDVPTNIQGLNTDYGIRLYCIYLTNNLVILLNGDIKTSQKAQDCQKVANHFNLAVRLAKAIDKAKIDQDLNWNPSGTTIVPEEIDLQL